MGSADYLKRLVELLSRPYCLGRHYDDRAQFMAVIGALFGGAEVWVCLWLLDEGEEQRELRLDQVVCLRDGILVGKYSSSSACSDGVFALLSKESALDPICEVAKRMVSHKLPSGPLVSIATTIGLHGDDEAFHPLADFDGADIGCIQVVASSGNGNGDVLPLAIRALADQIGRSREYRIWNRQKEIGADLIAADSVQAALNLVVDAVRRGCWAQRASITYTRCDPGKQAIRVECAVSDADCPSQIELITATAAKKKAIRLTAVRDGETMAPFAWMGVPVVVRSWTGGDDHAQGVVCVIEVVGKNHQGHFYRAFSAQDQAFVTGIASLLAEALPRLEMREAQKLIADAVEEIEVKSAAIIDTGNDVRIVFTSLEALVGQIGPCSTFSAVVGGGELIHLSDDAFRPAIASAVTLIDGQSAECILQVGSNRVYVIPLAHLEGGKNKLVIGISTPDILRYRKEIIGYLCREFSTLIGDRLRYRKMIQDLTETRHALRSGLTGVVTNLDAARRIFQRHRHKGAERLHTALVFEPEFSEYLDWASLFAQRTALFTDQTRLLLDNLTPESLKITFFDIERVVDEVVACLTPEANDRGCKISGDRKIPEGWLSGWADRDLIYILLFNIIDNAVKYSYRDRPIFINTTASHDQWHIRVTNFGVPIPKDRHQAIFRLFHRENSGMAPDSRRPGTGLGLPVAAMILAAHDPRYEIEVDSCEQQDGSWRTSFTIPIPRLLKGR